MLNYCLKTARNTFIDSDIVQKKQLYVTKYILFSETVAVNVLKKTFAEFFLLDISHSPGYLWTKDSKVTNVTDLTEKFLQRTKCSLAVCRIIY